MKGNPYLNEVDNKWYWFDETFDVSHSYDTKEEAEKDLLEYARWLNGESFNGICPYCGKAGCDGEEECSTYIERLKETLNKG